MIGIMAATLLIPNTVFTNASLNEPREELTDEERESGLYNEEGYLSAKHTRPPINPDFDPDESCKFDSFQIRCQPGSEQECPWGPGTNEDGSCVLDIECPDGYNIADDDETGQCIPNEICEGYDEYILIEKEGESDRCAALYYLCSEDGQREEEYCIEFCSEEPGRMGCRQEAN